MFEVLMTCGVSLSQSCNGKLWLVVASAAMNTSLNVWMVHLSAFTLWLWVSTTCSLHSSLVRFFMCLVDRLSNAFNFGLYPFCVNLPKIEFVYIENAYIVQSSDGGGHNGVHLIMLHQEEACASIEWHEGTISCEVVVDNARMAICKGTKTKYIGNWFTAVVINQVWKQMMLEDVVHRGSIHSQWWQDYYLWD